MANYTFKLDDCISAHMFVLASPLLAPRLPPAYVPVASTLPAPPLPGNSKEATAGVLPRYDHGASAVDISNVVDK